MIFKEDVSSGLLTSKMKRLSICNWNFGRYSLDRKFPWKWPGTNVHIIWLVSFIYYTNTTLSPFLEVYKRTLFVLHQFPSNCRTF